MDLNLEFLSIQNSWWSKGRKASLDFDPVIESYNQQALKWQPPVMDQLDLQHDNVYALFGSRSVGKTTTIKLLVKRLIEEKKIDPDNIFYYSCHNLDSYEQLNELVKIFLNWRKPEKPKRLFIFIDEISLVKNWQKGIDYLYRAGKLKNITLVLSGSSLGERLSQEKYITVKIISSLDFGGFLGLVNPQLKQQLNRRNYSAYQRQLDYYLDIYFLTGGFLANINEFKNHGAVRQQVYSNYLYWALADLGERGRDIILARQIIEKIIAHLGEPVGYQTLSHKTKAKTHLTIAEYLAILEHIFAVRLVYQSERGVTSTSKAKKIYFTDPFVFWLFYSYIHGSLDYWRLSREHLHRPEIFSALVENIVFSHLIKNEPINNWSQRVTYWRDNIKKREINFLVKSSKTATPILIRFNNQISPDDKNIFQSNGYKTGVIISRKELNIKNKTKILPLTYFLLFYKDLM